MMTKRKVSLYAGLVSVVGCAAIVYAQSGRNRSEEATFVSGTNDASQPYLGIFVDNAVTRMTASVNGGFDPEFGIQMISYDQGHEYSIEWMPMEGISVTKKGTQFVYTRRLHKDPFSDCIHWFAVKLANPTDKVTTTVEGGKAKYARLDTNESEKLKNTLGR